MHYQWVEIMLIEIKEIFQKNTLDTLQSVVIWLCSVEDRQTLDCHLTQFAAFVVAVVVVAAAVELPFVAFEAVVSEFVVVVVVLVAKEFAVAQYSMIAEGSILKSMTNERKKH